MRMWNFGKHLAQAGLILLLIFFLGGCVRSVVLKDKETITPHPSDPSKVCLDKGYLIEVFETCGKEVK